MSPADLVFLIHCYAMPNPHRNVDGYRQTIRHWEGDGIIKEDPNLCDKYDVTDRGKKWMEMILETPYPEFKWIDPRKEVK